jgi:hypothetical protein
VIERSGELTPTGKLTPAWKYSACRRRTSRPAAIAAAAGLAGLIRRAIASGSIEAVYLDEE